MGTRGGRVIDPYAKLPNPLIQNQRLTLSSSEPFVPKFVTSKLTQVANPNEVYGSRISASGKVWLVNPVRVGRAQKQRNELQAKRKLAKEKKKLTHIGQREAREKGIWRFDPAQAKFHLFLPLHHLWMSYMSELLGLHQPSSQPPTEKTMPGAAGMHPKLVKADFHGSIMTVRKSKHPDLVGLSGIVIHETENTFKVVTRKDQVKGRPAFLPFLQASPMLNQCFPVLPKQNSIFAFAVPLYSTLPATHTPESALPIPQLPLNADNSNMQTPTVLDGPHMEFELYGNQFCFRSADRASRKFKAKETIEL